MRWCDGPINVSSIVISNRSYYELDESLKVVPEDPDDSPDDDHLNPALLSGGGHLWHDEWLEKNERICTSLNHFLKKRRAVVSGHLQRLTDVCIIIESLLKVIATIVVVIIVVGEEFWRHRVSIVRRHKSVVIVFCHLPPLRHFREDTFEHFKSFGTELTHDNERKKENVKNDAKNPSNDRLFDVSSVAIVANVVSFVVRKFFSNFCVLEATLGRRGQREGDLAVVVGVDGKPKKRW